VTVLLAPPAQWPRMPNHLTAVMLQPSTFRTTGTAAATAQVVVSALAVKAYVLRPRANVELC